MIDKIRKFAEKYDMLHHGDSVVCALSGGADSVCLLICLSELSAQIGFSLEALHVNHCLRGKESDRDQEFCRNLCESLGIKFTAVSCDVRAYAEKASLSDEEAARKLRYDIFAEHSKGKIIATAHNANDNLETSVHNMIRGSALKGISGIPPVRDNIIRPLLQITRQEIENFLAERRISFVTDSTNLSDEYTRNKIRHRIIPLFTEINSSAVNTFINSSDALRDENDFIEAETEKAMNICRKGNILFNIGDFHPVIRRRCIARMLSEMSLPYSHDRLEECDKIAVGGGKIDISGNIFLTSDGNVLKLEKIKPTKQQIELSRELQLGKNSIFQHKALFAELIENKHLQELETVNKKLAIYYLDCDKIIGKVFVRNRRFGDKIRLPGRNFTSSVKKLINENIPAEQRTQLHFLEDDAGTLMAEGIGIADRAAPNESTMNYLKVTIASC